MKRRAFMGCLLACVLMIVQIAVAQVPLQPSKDNTLFEPGPNQGPLSNGAGLHLFVGRLRTGEIRRGVLAFDIAGNIPAGATITHVQLNLNLSKTTPASRVVTVHRLLNDWGEGASNAGTDLGRGAKAESNDATWQHTFFDPSDPNLNQWNKQGGDFETVKSASQQIGTTLQVYTWDSQNAGNVGLLSDVQAWLDGTASNFGWLLRDDESMFQTAKRFDSQESGTPPTLVVTFTSPNMQPLADAGPDQEVYESLAGAPTLVTLDGSASMDPDGTIKGYTWTQTAGPLVALVDETTAHPTFTAPEVGVSECPDETCDPAVFAARLDELLTFELTVTDQQDLMSTPDSVNITILGTDSDEDGVRDTVENGVPNNGDGNSDGTLDSQQPHVTSLPNPNTENRAYISLIAPEGTALADVQFLLNPPAEAPANLRFPWGFLVFTVLDVPPGDAVMITLLPPPNHPLDADAFYYKFGPTPETPEDHFYEFTFDGTTGAEILTDRIQLHLIDGARGDLDLTADGQINDPGALTVAAQPLPNDDGGGSGGGCNLVPSDQRVHGWPGEALGNILLPVLAMLILYGSRRCRAGRRGGLLHTPSSTRKLHRFRRLLFRDRAQKA